MRTVFEGWVGRRIKRTLVLLLVMVVGVLLTQACSGDGGSAETDRAAMVALFHSTDGTIAKEILPFIYYSVPRDQWESNSTIQQWKSIVQEDDTLLDEWEKFLENIDVLTEKWDGWVKTDGKGRIILLDLGGPGFRSYFGGELPPELGNLRKLEVLDLHGYFQGGIPSELGNLSSLKVLKLYCEFTRTPLGEIPPELGNLRRLEVLELSGRLTGEIPPELGNLRRLKELTLSGEDLTGEIPPELGNLRRLEVLELRGRFTGEIPPELGDLDNLESLYLYSNQLTGCKPHTWRSITDRYTYRLKLPFCESP